MCKLNCGVRTLVVFCFASSELLLGSRTGILRHLIDREGCEAEKNRIQRGVLINLLQTKLACNRFCSKQL